MKVERKYTEKRVLFTWSFDTVTPDGAAEIARSLKLMGASNVRFRKLKSGEGLSSGYRVFCRMEDMPDISGIA